MEEAPMEVWLEIIKKHPFYWRLVAHNKTAPLEILELLRKMDETVRKPVGQKRKLSLELFERLSSDPSSAVRFKIARNKKVPLSTLEKITSDKEQDVARIAKKTLKIRANLGSDSIEQYPR